jgi:hypothetical protein
MEPPISALSGTRTDFLFKVIVIGQSGAGLSTHSCFFFHHYRAMNLTARDARKNKHRTTIC